MVVYGGCEDMDCMGGSIDSLGDVGDCVYVCVCVCMCVCVGGGGW